MCTGLPTVLETHEALRPYVKCHTKRKSVGWGLIGELTSMHVQK